MPDRIEEFSPRNEGCRAKLEDDGFRQEVPVCMGGTAIVGCNNPPECVSKYHQRIDDTRLAHVMKMSEEGTRIVGVTYISRGQVTERA
ncbi:MAG TPA: hypothetical protein VJJ78_04145 [Candidatus Saccharimonadales bacterium]|nr:hypothetical protein [Candidatus Saccharimonadales bacterium]